MKIHHLNCATLCPVAARFLTGDGSLLDRAKLVCHCLLIETNDGLVLVDTGIGLEDIANPNSRLGRTFVAASHPRFDPEETAARQVERLGFRRSDVRHIVLTHLDPDHAGGLSDFPDAVVHVHRLELKAAEERLTANERERYRPLQIAHGPRWALHEAHGERWFGFDSVRALQTGDPEVLLIPLFGHTRGHTGVAVKDNQGWMLHAGDAYFHRAEMDLVNAHCPPGLKIFQSVVEMDHQLRVFNQVRLRELKRSANGEVRLFCAHDAIEFDTLRAESGL